MLKQVKPDICIVETISLLKDVEDLKIDDFELKDVSFDMDVKTNSEPSVQVTNSENTHEPIIDKNLKFYFKY